MTTLPPFLCPVSPVQSCPMFATNYVQAVEYLKEMPAAGVPPTLSHFKQALKACERATSRGLTGGTGGRSTSSSSSRSSGSATSSSSSGEGGGRHGWESDVAAAVAAVPVILELVRETPDLSPDDDCYSSAMRCVLGVYCVCVSLVYV